MTPTWDELIAWLHSLKEQERGPAQDTTLPVKRGGEKRRK